MRYSYTVDDGEMIQAESLESIYAIIDAARTSDRANAPKFIIFENFEGGLSSILDICQLVAVAEPTADRVTIIRQEGATIVTTWGEFKYTDAETALADFQAWCRDIGAEIDHAGLVYGAGWRYAETHPEESTVPEWIADSEWCAGFADARYAMGKSA